MVRRASRSNRGSDVSPVEPIALEPAVERAFAAPVALLALGIPLCPSCELLKVTLGEIASARPSLAVLFSAMESAEDWAARETLLWPRGISVSRASVPAMVIVRDGAVVASRQGGGPASQIDAWIAETLGPAEHPISQGVSANESVALEAVAQSRAQLLAQKAARGGNVG